MYAHVTNGTPDQFGRPPAIFQPAGGRWYDHRASGPIDTELALIGWYPVVEVAQPADTDTHTHDRSYTFDGDSVNVVWTQRPWTQAELDARTAAANEQTLRDGIAAEIAALKTSIDALKTGVLDVTNSTINGSPASHIKDVARAVRTTERSLIRVLKLISGVADTDLGAT